MATIRFKGLASPADVLEYVANVLAPRVEAVDKEFAQKHGLQTDPNIESAI